MWQDKKVAILGFGYEGQAMAEYVLGNGAEVTICDKKSESGLGDAYEKWKDLSVDWQLGEAYLDNLERFIVIIRSPGIPSLHPALEAARAAGVQVTSQTREFFANSSAPIIGVTGTKGKGTTATLIHRILEAGGKQSFLAGNIGISSISLLPKLKPNDWVIYELSSFQLQDIVRSPHIAVLLGITVDHQDYHESPDEYIAAKANILKFQNSDDVAIFNTDYPSTLKLQELARGMVFHTSLNGVVENGVYVDGDAVVRRLGQEPEIVISRKDIALKGDFNLENIAAAVMATTVVGVNLEVIKEVLKNFIGLPHRFEFIQKVKGIEYWNNSYGTTPETTIAAVRSFKEPIVLMLGGYEKGFKYDELGKAVATSSVKTVVGMGENSKVMFEKILEAAKKLGKSEPNFITGGDTMKEMVEAATMAAVKGDVVLLSPAAASFDKFKNVVDRGEQFKRIVIAL